MKIFCLLLVVVAVSGISCERHSFDGPDGTRQLQERTASNGGPSDSAERPSR